jgi:hypothetical protein
MEELEASNWLLLEAQPGDGFIRVVRPVHAGERLAIGEEPDDLVIVTVTRARDLGYVAEIEPPLPHGCRGGCPIGYIIEAKQWR